MELTIEAVRVEHPGCVLGPFTFGLGPGVHHLLGPNGAGKSTLLAVIAASIPCDGGRVLLNGRDPELESAVRARIGYVPTTPLLPGFLTIDEAWRMQARLRGRPEWSGDGLRDALGLPGDLRLDRASTGMRRKASLIAALAGDPEVLLLDETLANIDTDSLPVVIERVLQAPIVVLTHHGALPEGLAARTLSLRATGRSGS